MCEQEEQLLLHSCPGRGGHLRSVRLRACPAGVDQIGDPPPAPAPSPAPTLPAAWPAFPIYRRGCSASPRTQANGNARAARPQPMAAPLAAVLPQPASNSWCGVARDSPPPPQRTMAPPSGAGRRCRVPGSDPPSLPAPLLPQRPGTDGTPPHSPSRGTRPGLPRGYGLLPAPVSRLPRKVSPSLPCRARLRLTRSFSPPPTRSRHLRGRGAGWAAG